ncbi:MAG: DUF4294 domain-containing protein [Bacteroidia bacterium]
MHWGRKVLCVLGMTLLYAQARGEDSLRYGVTLPPVIITDKAPRKKDIQRFRQQWRDFERLRRNVHLLYPLAQEAAQIMVEVDTERSRLGKKSKDYKAYADRLERQLFQKYEPLIRELTISQGVILIKLIHRQTGVCAYDIIKEFKGGLSARFWQWVAQVYGSSLKYTYQPEREVLIEAVIQEIETGQSADYLLILREGI